MHATNAVTRSAIAVVRLSEAFSSLWQELADGLDVDARFLDGEGAVPASAQIAATIVAAGGAEREALHWLDQFGVPDKRPVFIVGSDTGRRTAIQAMVHGATDYFALPDDIEVLRNAVALAVEQHTQLVKNASTDLAGAKARAFQSLVGESKALESVLRRAQRILPHPDATALIVGETGTGKELLARAIHSGSPRRTAPFVPVNCSALPERLVESELFGHERGAFTGAYAVKPGLFEVADGGTLFLDEVGTLPLDLQAKLLRVLEDKQIRRVGGTKSRAVDIRIIAATNTDLERAIHDGHFRQDLYFRLGIITLELPPLRDRGHDILLIAKAQVERLAEHHQVPVPHLHPDACSALLTHHWPGNVRELKNAIERALLLSPPGELDVCELVQVRGQPLTINQSQIPFPARLSVISEAVAQATLGLCDGNRSETARRLGISRNRLRRLLDGATTFDETV